MAKQHRYNLFSICCIEISESDWQKDIQLQQRNSRNVTVFNVSTRDAGSEVSLQIEVSHASQLKCEKFLEIVWNWKIGAWRIKFKINTVCFFAWSAKPCRAKVKF